MSNQELKTENKLGKNWRTLAIVAVILVVGAVVMGHSLLSGDRTQRTGEDGTSTCSMCSAGGACPAKATTAQASETCCGSEVQGKMTVENVAAMVSDTGDTPACCGANGQCCADTDKTCCESCSGCGACPASASSGCSACPASTGAKSE